MSLVMSGQFLYMDNTVISFQFFSDKSFHYLLS